MENTREILKRTSRSLYLSIAALPTGMRPGFSCAYLLCRAADSIADTAVVAREVRLRRVHAFSSLLTNKTLRKNALAELSADISGAKDSDEKSLLAALPRILEEYDALSEDDRGLIYSVVCEVCVGMETDLTVFGSDEATLASFDNPQQLEEYCRRIGGGPGAFWTCVAMLHGALGGELEQNHAQRDFISQEDGDYAGELVRKGRVIGEGLQLVNILRDTPRDLRIGRCYWPKTDLAEAGLSPADLLRVESATKFKKVLAKWTLAAVDKLNVAEEYVSALPKTQLGLRAAVIWPILWGLDTLHEVWKAANPLDPAIVPKIPRSRVYFTFAGTPALLLSNTAFIKGYRLRRETLLSAIPSKF